MHVRRFGLALLAAALAVTSVSGAAAGDEPGRPGQQVRPGKPGTTITLITGDQVHLTKGKRGYAATAVAGPGRQGVVFSTERKGDSIWVYPSDTAAEVASGLLDRRLFEVTALAREGYADGESKSIPLIIQHSKGKPVRTLPKGAAVSRELASATATAVEQDKQTAAGFWKWLDGEPAGVKKVWLDGRVRASLDRSVPQVGAPAAWAKGYTGKGVKVAVLDTGIDATHLDLKGSVAVFRNFSSSLDHRDYYGHGTYIASIITGDGARSAGKYKGVAPDVTLLNGKVLGDDGYGYESDVIAGMEWAVAQQARVVNLSFSGGATDGTDALAVALNQLSTSSGTLFVVPVGNHGPNRYTIGTPGSATEALSVAATNRDQTTASFSSAGPRVGDYLVKPEIAAPGAEIVAARALDTGIGTPVDSYYTKFSGTSAAAPHVAGAAAILAQQQPTWNARLLKAALMGTAKLPVNDSVYRQGAGFLDVSRAVTQKVFALEGSVSAHIRWPYRQQPVTRVLTYRNPGATPLTLNLGFRPVDQNGNVAPAGLFSMPASVTVPARTTAKVTLTIDPSKAQPGRQYQGRLNATATGIVVRTPVSVNFETESYDIELEIIDRAGNRVDNLDDGRLAQSPYLINVAKQSEETYLRLEDGRFVARVPRGVYSTAMFVFSSSGGDRTSMTLLHTPRVAVTAPATVTLDAREALRTTAVVEAEGATTKQIGMALSQQVGSEAWSISATYGSDVREPVAYALPGQATGRPYDFLLYQQLSAPDREYELALGRAGGVPADPTFPVADSELADVSVVFGGQGAGLTGSYSHLLSIESNGRPAGFSSSYAVSIPSTRRHLISASALGAPTEWESMLIARRADGNVAYQEHSRVRERFEAGKPSTIKFGTAAFSPQGTGELRAAPSFMQLWFGPYDSSGGGRISGFNGTHSGDIVLKRNGVQIASSSTPTSVYVDDLPAGTATYTAVMHASRTVPWSPYVPRVSGTWTFKATTPSSGTAPLHIVSTRVSGTFDEWGRAPRGVAFPLTLDVSGASGGVATATARVSYDDGQTWTTVPVSNASGKWVATVSHPANPASSFVSLRIVVTDQQGNSGGWTATRAYQLATAGS